MVQQISDANILREIGSDRSQTRTPPASPAVPDKQTDLRRGNRIQALEAAVEKLIRNSLPDTSRLEIRQDSETGTFIYRSVDPETGEVTSQWPPEQLLQLRESLREMQGMLFDTEA